MDQKTHVIDHLKGMYGSLLFEVRKTDTAWEAFEVIWSDDGGMTRISEEWTIDNMSRVSAVLPKERIKALLDEVRTDVADDV